MVKLLTTKHQDQRFALREHENLGRAANRGAFGLFPKTGGKLIGHVL